MPRQTNFEVTVTFTDYSDGSEGERTITQRASNERTACRRASRRVARECITFAPTHAIAAVSTEQPSPPDTPGSWERTGDDDFVNERADREFFGA